LAKLENESARFLKAQVDSANRPAFTAAWAPALELLDPRRQEDRLPTIAFQPALYGPGDRNQEEEAEGNLPVKRRRLWTKQTETLQESSQRRERLRKLRTLRKEEVQAEGPSEVARIKNRHRIDHGVNADSLAARGETGTLLREEVEATAEVREKEKRTKNLKRCRPLISKIADAQAKEEERAREVRRKALRGKRVRRLRGKQEAPQYHKDISSTSWVDEIQCSRPDRAGNWKRKDGGKPKAKAKPKRSSIAPPGGWQPGPKLDRFKEMLAANPPPSAS